MKTVILLFLLLIISLTGCIGEIAKANTNKQTDTIAPIINITGKKNDVVYQYTTYTDLGAEVLKKIGGQLRYTAIPLKITGKINTNIPGTYFLDYDACDVAGNTAVTVTRTIQVVQKQTAF